MKKTVLGFLMAFFLVISMAYAADIIVSEDSVYCDVYSRDDTYAAETKALIAEDCVLTVRNNISSNIEIVFTETELSLSGEDEILNISNPGYLIAANSTQTITLDFDDIDELESGIYIGTLNIVNKANPSQIYDTVSMKALIPSVVIKDIEITDKESGAKDTKLEKGQKFTVTVEVENIAKQTNLENVELVVGVYEGDDNDLKTLLEDIDGDELEEEDDMGDIKDGRADTISFDFEMPYDIDDGDEFTVFVEVTADAEDTTSKFYARDTKEFESTVEDSEIKISKAMFIPSTLACGEERVKVSIELTNIGDDEEEVQLFIRNTATAFEKMLNDGEIIELNDDFTDEDEFIASIDEYVTLDDLKTGENTYSIVAYYTDDASVTEDITLNLLSCDAEVVSDEAGDEIVVDTSSQTQTTTQTTSGTPTTSYVKLKEVGAGFDSDWVVPVVIGVGGLIVGIIVAFLVIPKP